MIIIEVQDHAGIKVVVLEGELAGDDDGNRLIRTVNGVLEGRGARAILDMGGTKHISSTGISALVRVIAQANTQEQRVLLANPMPFIADVLETTKLNRFFEIYPSVDGALNELRH